MSDSSFVTASLHWFEPLRDAVMRARQTNKYDWSIIFLFHIFLMFARNVKIAKTFVRPVP